MSEICKELVCLATRCRATKPSQMNADLMREIVDSLYHASVWIGISEISHREDRAMIQELRRLLGDETGRIAPPKARGYASPVRATHPPPEWQRLGKIRMEA